MNNPFFRIALGQANRIMGKSGRILQLIALLTQRLYTKDYTNISGELKERLYAIGRLLSAYALGRYPVIPLKTVLTVTAGILYFLNPFDLIPDAIFGLGLTDDIAVLAWVYRVSQLEISKFIQWEKARTSTAGLNIN